MICTKISPNLYFNTKKIGEMLPIAIILDKDTSSFLTHNTFDNTIDCVDYIDKVCTSHFNIVVKNLVAINTNFKVL